METRFEIGEYDMGKQGNAEWTEQRVKATTWLSLSFPAIFSLDIKPLKIGITQDILAMNLDGAPDEALIRRAIGYHVRSHFYLRHMKLGAYRFNIDGLPDGDVTEIEAASAKAMLIARQKKSAQKATRIKIDRKVAKKLTAAAIVTNKVLENTHALTAPETGGKKILMLKKKSILAFQGA